MGRLRWAHTARSALPWPPARTPVAVAAVEQQVRQRAALARPRWIKVLFDVTGLARSSVVRPDALTEHQQVGGQQFSRTLHA